jgi:uncharacterized protein (TIGR02391 family)
MNLQTHIRVELWAAISSTYQAENYTHSIVDAMHYLSDILREKSGAEGDGTNLVGHALGGDTPRLRVNKLQTETEKNIQKGLVQILMGMYTAIRNPRSHEQIQDDQSTADAIIYFVNYILSILDQSQQQFTVENFLFRVFDSDFVESDRYAALLIAEIPAKRQLDILIEIYRQKARGDGRKLAYVVKALCNVLSESQIADFIKVVSDDLRIIFDDKEVRSVFQLLPPELWVKVDELARLRIESKVIQYIKLGEAYLDQEDWTIRCNSPGAIGTWTRKFLKHFSINEEVNTVVLTKLQDNDINSKRYVAEYFILSLPDFIVDPANINHCVNILAQAVRKEDFLIKTALINIISKFPVEWQKTLAVILKDLTDENNPATYLSDGTPFLANDYNDFAPPPDDVSDIPF